jgi:hypothetical protein
MDTDLENIDVDAMNKSEKDKRNSQAFLKFINYIETLKNNPAFMSELRLLRSYYVDYNNESNPFPLEGIPLPQDKQEHLENSMRYHPNPETHPDEKLQLGYVEFQKKKEAFAEKYGLDIFGEAYDYILYYGSVEPMKEQGFMWFAEVFDLIALSHIDEEKLGGLDDQKRLFWALVKSEIAPNTPVAICIHPYMTERDIIDFIKKTYKSSIEPIQKKYRKVNIKLRDVRTKSKKKQSRNAFIYEHRDMPIMTLTSLVSKTYGKILDYTYIQTIIRKEIEKRN